MRRALVLPGIVMLMAGASCASSPKPVARASATSPAPAGGGAGATSQQAADGNDPARPLTHEECQQLGQSIIDTCHDNNTRSDVIDGWCSDVITGVHGGNWVADCEQHIKYLDAVCFASTDSPKAMMDCDAAVSR